MSGTLSDVPFSNGTYGFGAVQVHEGDARL